MSVSGIAAQQAQLQTNIALSVIKQNAKAEQSLVNMIDKSAHQFRGKNVDISV